MTTPGLEVKRRIAAADDLAAPEPVDPPFAAPERTTLESGLEFHRATLLLTCDGLSDEQRKRGPVATGTPT